MKIREKQLTLQSDYSLPHTSPPSVSRALSYNVLTSNDAKCRSKLCVLQQRRIFSMLVLLDVL